MEPATLATGEMTVVDGGDEATGPAVAITGSGRRVAVGAGGAPAMAAPAMSRVRAAVQPGVSMATSKRTMAVYQAKSASPFITTFAVLTSIVFLMSASIVVVMMSRGSFDPASGQRIIPPFLDKHAYRTFYDWTPGKTQDPKPQTEFPNKMIAPQ